MRQCAKHAPPHRFVCLTDNDMEFVETHRLIHAWPGWWSKGELFRPGLFEGRVWYFDLDTLIVGDISKLLCYDGPMATLSDFYQLRRPASGVMTWTGDEGARIYETLEHAGPGKGRMDYFLERLISPERLQTLFPDQIVSLKAHAKSGPPPGARVVCAHGRPRFDESRAGWAHHAWMQA